LKMPIFPHGLSLGQGSFRPAMIFKDKSEREILPVWLDPLEANLLLATTQSGVRNGSTHSASMKLFDAFSIKLKSVYFDDVTNGIQYATLSAYQDKKLVTVRVRAAEAMSMVLNAGCAFYSNRGVIEKSRAMSFEQILHMAPGPGPGFDAESMH
jgi:bifunctional DNase/RNase